MSNVEWKLHSAPQLFEQWANVHECYLPGQVYCAIKFLKKFTQFICQQCGGAE